MFICQYCADFSVRTHKKLLRHIRFVHSNEPNFSISCGHCGQSFKRFESFKSHLRRKHKDVDEDEDENKSLDQSDLIPDAGSDFDLDGEEEHNMFQDQVMETKNSTDEMTRHIALFILMSKEQNQLNQTVLDSILGNTADLSEQSLQGLKEYIISCLQENDIEIPQVNALNDILERPSNFAEAVAPVGNDYLQKKYFVENFNQVVSLLLI